MPITKIVNEDFSSEAIEVYERFKQLDLSEHIAKPVTLDAILKICRIGNLRNVLEMGGGLGTISFLILKYTDAHLDIYEHSQVFAEKLQENLSEFRGRFTIIDEYTKLPPQRKYDLVIVDGGQQRKGNDGSDPRMGFNESVWHYLKYLKAVRFVYVEGNRHIQRTWVRKALKGRYIYSLIRYGDFQYKGETLSGGLLIKCHPSRSRILRFINYWFWELVEWKTIRNAIYYRMRYFKLKK